MTFLPLFFSKNYLYQYASQWKQILKSIFYFFGIIAAILTISIFLFNIDIQTQIKDYCFFGVIFVLIIVIGYGLWINRPKLSIIQQIPHRDIEIEIRVADMFDLKGSYIIGTNTTFDTEIGDDLIAEKSVQGQFTKKFFMDYKDLGNRINEKLVTYPFDTVNFEKKGNVKSYEMGTVVKIKKNNIIAYFVAMARLNEQGVAQSSIEDIIISLNKLWEFISTHGGTEPIIIAIFGSRFGRLIEKRDQIVDKIIQSFVIACISKKCTEKLIIVIHPVDFLKWNLNLAELKRILEYHCHYPNF